MGLRTFKIPEGGMSGGQLSARLQRPLCMLMRANRILSPAFFTPGREIAVPDANFCQYDGFICPSRAARCPAGSALSEKRMRASLPERLQIALRGRKSGMDFTFGFVYTAGISDTMARLAARFAVPEDELRFLNAYWGPVLPGVRLFVPGGDGADFACRKESTSWKRLPE